MAKNLENPGFPFPSPATGNKSLVNEGNIKPAAPEVEDTDRRLDASMINVCSGINGHHRGAISTESRLTDCVWTDLPGSVQSG
ncbi:MAG: hypothetical protein RLO38_14790, partial [Roseovarius confluentis]